MKMYTQEDLSFAGATRTRNICAWTFNNFPASCPRAASMCEESWLYLYFSKSKRFYDSKLFTHSMIQNFLWPLNWFPHSYFYRTFLGSSIFDGVFKMNRFKPICGSISKKSRTGWSFFNRTSDEPSQTSVLIPFRFFRCGCEINFNWI